MNLYEKVKNMSIDEMAEFLNYVACSSFFVLFGMEKTVAPEYIKSLPQYRETLASAKEMLLSERQN